MIVRYIALAIMTLFACDERYSDPVMLVPSAVATSEKAAPKAASVLPVEQDA
jgi:hypothetical protein